jgi:hypothetical protein
MDIPASLHFKPVDLSALFNVSAGDLPATLKLPDDLEGRHGHNTFRGIPFDRGPAEGRNVILLDQDPVDVPVHEATATYIVFLHAVEDRVTNYAQGLADFQADGNQMGNRVSDYRIRYADGSEIDHAILRRFAVQQGFIHWGASPFASVPSVWDQVVPTNAGQIALGRPDMSDFGRGECRTKSGREVNLGKRHAWLYALPNPHPHKPIGALRLEPATEKSTVYGISLADVREHPLRAQVRRKVLLTLPEGIAFNAIGELDDVAVDLGTVISARQQFVYDHDLWAEAQPDVQPQASAQKAVVEYAAHPQGRLYVRNAAGDLDAHDLETLDGPSVISIAPAVHKVRIRVVDKASGRPVGVRLHMHGEQGEYLPPKGYHRRVNANWFEDNYAEFANHLNQYAYIDGSCEADLPHGRVYVDISRGYEVTPIRTHIDIGPGTDEVRFELERVLDWRGRGWVTADTHVHFLSPATAQLEGNAEDVNVVNLLASQWGEMFSNVGDFDGRTTHGATDSAMNGEFLVRVGTENRMQVLGHISLLGYSGQMIHPLCTGGPSESAIGDPLEVTMADWARRCREQNGLVVMPHAPNPQCERAADIVLGVVHAMEMMTFNPYNEQINPYGIADWYRFLNLGYQLPVVGGSDKMAASSLLGGVRTYTQLGERPFTYENWMEATRAGHTFVTVGPLIDMEVQGNAPGSQLQLPKSGGTLNVSWQAESVRVPICAVEVVVGGETVEVHHPDDAMTARGSTDIKVNASTWIAVRIRGSYHGRDADIAAHTSTVHVFCGKQPIYAPKDAMDVLKQIEGAIAFVDTIAPRPEADAYRKLRLTLESAWNTLHQRMHQQGNYHEHSPLHDHAEHHEH